MTSKYFDYSVLQEKCDFTKNHAFINDNGVCSLKAKGKPGWGQNPDLYQAYEKLVKLTHSELDSDFKNLSPDQLVNLSHFVHALYLKIDKSQKPSSLTLLGIEVYNLFASCFRMKKIEIYDYSKKNKILEISNRIKSCINGQNRVIVYPTNSSSCLGIDDSVVVDPPVNKKKDHWNNIAKKPKVNPLPKNEAGQSSNQVIEPVVSSYELDELKNSGQYPALLDALKKNYLDEIQAELKRLREGDVLTPALEKTLNANLNYVEKSKGFSADHIKFNREGIKVAVGRALEIKKYFRDKYYVITHSQDTRWVVVTYLIKEMVRHLYRKEKIHHFKFLRLPTDNPVPRSKFTSGSFDDDHKERRALISSDAYLFNNNSCESTLYFLSNNASVASYGGDTIITDTAKGIIQQMYPTDSILVNKLHQLVIKYVTEIGKKTPVGTLHVFCIPKDKALNGEYASLYRSHPYGVPCNCSHIKAMGDEKQIIDLLQNDTELKCSGGLRPQTRIIAPNLKPEEVMIKSFTPFDKSKRHEIKKAIREIING